MHTNEEKEIPPAAETTVSLRIPLEIRLDLEKLQVVSGTIPTNELPHSDLLLDSDDIQETRKMDDVSAELLQSALATLEQSQARDYYNEAEDRQNQEKYYQAIDWKLSSQDLYQSLSELARQTHRTYLKYKPAIHLYPDVDLQPDGTILSIYSGIEYQPKELILDDFRIDQERGMRLREMMRKGVGWGGETLVQELDLLESSLPYNCEHVVPQSWFDKREPMRGDLHHLFACEMTCNSFRSNIPYYDFSDFGEATMSKCGKRDDNKFEPHGGKSAVARAVLYFLLRYPGEINRTKNEYTEDRLEILRSWHRSLPPSEYELHRNAVIFSKQGNRNPFIDFPDLDEKVDLRLGLG